MTVGLRDMLRAIREYPAVRAELETSRTELRQAQQALEQNQQNCESLLLTSNEQQEYMNFLSHKAEALQNALGEFCPRLSTPEDMKRFYDAISPSMDAQGFTLYHMAKELTGMERYDEETLAKLQDNRLEYQEIRDRIHEYNPTFTKIWEDYMDGRADYAYLVTELESQYRVVKDTVDGYISISKLPGMSAMASMGRSLDKSYRNLVQNMRDTVNQWETNTQAQRQFQQVEKQLTVPSFFDNIIGQTSS